MSERRRVLIIDEEVDLAMLMRSYYTRKNYEVYIAHTYASGLAVAIQHQPDLICLDAALCIDFKESRDMLQKHVPHARIISPENWHE